MVIIAENEPKTIESPKILKKMHEIQFNNEENLNFHKITENISVTHAISEDKSMTNSLDSTNLEHHDSDSDADDVFINRPKKTTILSSDEEDSILSAAISKPEQGNSENIKRKIIVEDSDSDDIHSSTKKEENSKVRNLTPFI